MTPCENPYADRAQHKLVSDWLWRMSVDTQPRSQGPSPQLTVNGRSEYREKGPGDEVVLTPSLSAS